MQNFIAFLQEKLNILEEFLSPVIQFTDFMWGVPMIALVTLLTLFYVFYLRGFQFRNIRLIYQNTLKTYFHPQSYGEGNIPPIKACMNALAGMIGTGNITGVAVAISGGGPGAIFWMVVIALMISIVKFAEITLGMIYREKDAETGEWRSGLMYIIQKAFGTTWKPLAFIWALLLSIQYIFGPSIQTNAIADILNQSFGIDKLWIGLLVSACAGLILIGGLKRITEVSAKLVPSMSLLYIICSLLILVLRFDQILPAFGRIFQEAFNFRAVSGGAAGIVMIHAIRNGLARGMLSNEAGMGSAPFFHAASQTDLPARQGLWGIFEVFFDTIILCTLSALVILVSGAYDAGVDGAKLNALAFTSVLPLHNIGAWIISISVTLFAFSSLICDAFIGTSCFNWVLKTTKFKHFYTSIILFTIVLGAVMSFGVIWSLWDTIMLFTVSINLLVLFLLRKQVKSELQRLLVVLKNEQR